MKAVEHELVKITALALIFCMMGLFMSGTATAQCHDNGDGTVTDSSTGLMWQKTPECYTGWSFALVYVRELSLGGHSDWRLPRIEELEYLYKSQCKNMLNAGGKVYWSCTPVFLRDPEEMVVADDSDQSYAFSFGAGERLSEDRRLDYYVLAVRAAQ